MMSHTKSDLGIKMDFNLEITFLPHKIHLLLAHYPAVLN